MKDSASRAQIGANPHFGDDAVGRHLRDANAHEAGKERSQQFLDRGEIEHGKNLR
jgi:hypothetical protein